MTNFFEHQKTIGIVGTGSDAERFIEAANELGYSTQQLIPSDTKRSTTSRADEIYQGTLSEETVREEFLMSSDYLVYFDFSVSSAELVDAEKSVVIPQGEELLAITQDRSLQKAFYESIGVNIAPYEVIVREEDITQAMPSIGYPAVLRKNIVQKEEAFDSYFIYEEADIQEASELLKYGPAVLESWIISEHQLAITAVKSNTGDIQLYPIVKKHYQNERLHQIAPFALENPELVAEIKKAAELIVANIPFVGVVSIEFIISPAHALYLGELHPYPNDLSWYTEASPLYSSTAAHLRAISSLPLVKIDPEKLQFSYHPLYADQQEAIEQAVLEESNVRFHFHPMVKEGSIDLDDQVGYALTDQKDWLL